jgi:hypothetical protein
LLGKFLLSTSFAVASIGIVIAASPVATVTSSRAFDLRGATVKPDGVPSWPVMAGDEIKTSSAPARILFRDGSRVTLDAATAVRVEESVSGVNVRLSSGSMEVLSRSSALQVYQNSNAMPIVPGKLTKVSTSTASQQDTGSKRVLIAKPPSTPGPVSNR